MGFFDYISDLYASVSIQATEAEEQQYEGPKDKSGFDESDEEAEINKQDKKDDGPAESTDDEGEEEGGDDAGDDEEEEEEEEEEPEDIKPKLEEECLKTAQCAPAKHHYDECVERVTHQQEEKGKAEEDCVEEFFHMMHCATQCAAPKLFKALR